MSNVTGLSVYPDQLTNWHKTFLLGFNSGILNTFAPLHTMNRSELQQRISSVKKELEKLENELKETPVSIAEAKAGDTLNDGCIVIERYSDYLLIASPVEVSCHWTRQFKPLFEQLEKEGFIPSQWYVPSKEELQLAYKNCRQLFSPTFYWSSTEYSSARACSVNFINGIANGYFKTGTDCVRAFRRYPLDS